MCIYVCDGWGSDPWLSLVGGIAWLASATTHFHYTCTHWDFFSLSVSHNVLNQIPFKYFLRIMKNWADTDHWPSKQSSVDFQKRTNSQAHFHGQMTFCSICWGLTRMVFAGAGDDVDTDQLKGVRWLSGNLCCCLLQVKRVLCRSTPLPPIFSPSRHVPTKGASESTTLAL